MIQKRFIVGFIAFTVFALSGCSTVKGWLRPWVCADGACACPCEGTHTVAEHAAQESDDELGDTGDEVAEEPDEIVTQTEIPKGNPYDEVTIWDPQATIDLADGDAVEQISENFSTKGVELKAPNQAVRGRFTRRGGDELVVITPGSEILIFNARGTVAKRETGRSLSDAQELPMLSTNGGALIRDGRSEIALVTQAKSGDATEVYFSVYKVFGREIGRVFDWKIGEVHEGRFVPYARVRFLRGDRDPFIEVTPVREGAADESQRQIFHWNHWEGMFRIPHTPPTAPKRT